MSKVTWLMILYALCLTNCAPKQYATNGETIYKTGYNVWGEKMVNRKASRIPFVRNCATCHGKNGDAMKNVSIRFKDLASRKNYTEAFFYRFLDEDLKSDGSKADIGIIWKMSDQDKKDLLDYLKTL